MSFIASVFGAGLVMGVFSSCGRHEADTGNRALPSTAERPVADTTPARGKSKPAAERSWDRRCVVRSATGLAMAAPGDEARPVYPGNGLGAPVASGNVAEDGRMRPQPKPLPTPLVAVGFGPSVRLSAGQAQQAVKLAEDFLAATADESAAASGTSAPAAASADATSAAAKTAFEARWRSAQQKSDAQFKMLFGYAAFNSQQILRVQQEYRDQQAGK